MATVPGTRFLWPALLSFCLLVMEAASPVFASDWMMKAPASKKSSQPVSGEQFETSCVRLACVGSIRFYQKWISPIGGSNRCGFSPSCSAFGYQAIQEQGAAVGILMTADRLTRCNIWKGPESGYTLLPNGRLYDPVSGNLLGD